MQINSYGPLALTTSAASSSEATYSTPVATIRLLISASASGLLSGLIVQAG